ncbi:hypothetical protein LUZ60_002855 [Juncus effusus]|nr:hypothetical protein LUZ60_002855 [Juncus effusus]
MDSSDSNRFPDLLSLLKSWMVGRIPTGSSNPNPNPQNLPRDFWMPDQSCRVCYDCDSQFTLIHRRHHCRLCGRVFCSKCTSFVPIHPQIKQTEQSERIRVCNYCLKQWEDALKVRNVKKESSESEVVSDTNSQVLSPSGSCASLASSKSSYTGQTSSSFTGGSNQNYDSAPAEYVRFDQAVGNPSEMHVKEAPNEAANNSCEHYQFCLHRSDEEDSDSAGFRSDSETLRCQISDDHYTLANFHQIPNSHQLDKEPHIASPPTNPDPKPASFPTSETASFTSSDWTGETRSSYDECSTASSALYNIERKDENMSDVENNRLLWVPPEADEGEEDVGFEDEDDAEPVSDWYQRSSSFGNGLFRSRERSAEEHKKVMKNVVDGHFKALITQLLQAEEISATGEREGEEGWLEIITRLAWEAASLLKPDTSKGGGMDPGGYVKVKCIASGCPSDSAVIKGVVCKKNVAHRRMSLKIEKPRILILGGALEYQRVSNLLSSFDTLLQQEMEYLRMAVAKIQAHQPNILLVEKAVSRSAQDLFLNQNISLVLNIKRPLLERIARCTGAQIVPSIDHLSNPKLGNCESFHVEKFVEKHGGAGEGGKQVVKTLMFFEDCPRPLGCTILLKGGSNDELKRVKHVIQYGIFAAYHLALETSFLADEGATLPELPLKTPLLVSLPEKNNVVKHAISLFNQNPSPSPQSNIERPKLSSIDSVNKGIFGFLSESFLSTQIAEKGGNNKVNDALNVDVSKDRFTGIEDEMLPSPSDHQTILVSLSSRCDWKKTACESPHLLRIKYYGSADRPLGRFLREQLFNQSYVCHFCEMPSEAHVYCYTHRLGCLTISVRKLPESHFPLPGESNGKIWMWHRCLKCNQINKLPPANKRVVMSDAAWGLSFGKFLELSFSNHASASRVASCGHSLHRDCLRFYGFGRMVACFRYAPIKVHNVYLPPSKLDFGFLHQEWVAKEAREVADFVELTFKEISDALQKVTDRKPIMGSLDANVKLIESWRLFTELDTVLQSETVQCKELVQRLNKKETKKGEPLIDILEVNKLRRQLIFLSYLWDQRLKLAANSIKEKGESNINLINSNQSARLAKPSDKPQTDDFDQQSVDTTIMNGQLGLMESRTGVKRVLSDSQFAIITDLSDKLDARWRGENGKDLQESTPQTSVVLSANEDPSKIWYKTVFSSFDESLSKNPNWPCLDVLGEYNPNYLPIFRDLARNNSARLFLPIGVNSTVIPVFDDEPTSVISYALVSHDYHSQLLEESVRPKEVNSTSIYPSGHLSDDLSSENFKISSSSDDPISSTKGNHIRVSFEENGALGKVKYTVLCYYAKYFESLRKKCCPREVDFVRSLSRCKKWGAQGGKSNVFFAKSLDDRFIIKQVTKTELESFMKFAHEYFKYLLESIGTKSPTCLAKILGIYQVTTKHVKGGKESKMDLLVMENLLFRRNVTRLYDLKGSSRSRYNSDQNGTNKVLLDQNLIEMMPTSPIFVGNNAKRLLERAIWNDTAFLASIDVMDYSLLVGVDEERHELVLGIIDFMRQYTWDKHLETWAKSAGILGGSKNIAPTVISPNLYKKRFRKAMSTYFIVVPDQWTPSVVVPSKSFSDLNQDCQSEEL